MRVDQSSTTSRTLSASLRLVVVTDCDLWRQQLINCLAGWVALCLHTNKSSHRISRIPPAQSCCLQKCQAKTTSHGPKERTARRRSSDRSGPAVTSNHLDSKYNASYISIIPISSSPGTYRAGGRHRCSSSGVRRYFSDKCRRRNERPRPAVHSNHRYCAADIPNIQSIPAATSRRSDGSGLQRNWLLRNCKSRYIVRDG